MTELAKLNIDIARISPAVWWEMDATVRDKERKFLTAPELEANFLQRLEDEIILYCRDQNLPCRIVAVKGRQQGSSTFGTGILYHMCQANGIKACIIGDEYEKSVKNLVDMFEFYYDTDRYPWGHEYHKPSRKFSHGSELVTETANDPRAGASGTMQAVLATEVAHWKETGVISAKKTFTALLNCVPESPNTLIIAESTPNGVGGVFYETYQNAITIEDHKAGLIPANWNGFFRVFYPWHMHKEYTKPSTDAQAQQILDTLTERERELLQEHPNTINLDRLNWRRIIVASPKFNGDEDLFEQEYPSDDKRCFLLSGRSAFNQGRLTQMRTDGESIEEKIGVLEWVGPTKSKVIFRPTSEDEAIVRIWEMPKPGFRYHLPVDPATGKYSMASKDPDSHACGVMRSGTYDNSQWYPDALVARLCDGWAERRDSAGRIVCRWLVDILEDYLERLSVFYGRCPLAIENNSPVGLLEGLHEKGYELYRRRVHDRVEMKETDQLGWQTDKSTRGPMITDLQAAIFSYKQEGAGLAVWDKRVIKQLGTCIVAPNGRVEAMNGTHDDAMMMLAIGLQTKEIAKIYPFPQRSRRRYNHVYDDDDHSGGDMTYA